MKNFDEKFDYISNKLIYVFEFELEIKNDVKINKYKSSILRGILGNMLKKMTCPLKNNECDSCSLKNSCIYHTFFEKDIILNKEDKSIVRHLYKPYIIFSQNNSDIIKKGEKITFNLTLFGNSINYLPYIITSYILAGNYGITKDRIKYEIVSIKDLNNNIVYTLNVNNFTIKTDPVFITKEKNIPTKIRLNFITPFKLKKDSTYLKNIEISDLLINIIKRTYLISNYYYDNIFTYADYEDIKSQIPNITKNIKAINYNLKYKKYIRKSHKTGLKMNLDGLVGNIDFEGNFCKIFKYLKFGEYLHIGKNCSFGLGKYEIEYLR